MITYLLCSLFPFYLKSPIYFNFVSILSFAALLNKFLSVCNLHILTEIRDSGLCTLLGKTSVNILSIQMKIMLQWPILIFKLVWWSQACICNNSLHCRDFYIPIRWHGCLKTLINGKAAKQGNFTTSYFTFQSSLLIDSLYIVSDNMKQQLPNSDIKCDAMHVAIKMVTINAS